MLRSASCLRRLPEATLSGSRVAAADVQHMFVRSLRDIESARRVNAFI